MRTVGKVVFGIVVGLLVLVCVGYAGVLLLFHHVTSSADAQADRQRAAEREQFEEQARSFVAYLTGEHGPGLADEAAVRAAGVDNGIPVGQLGVLDGVPMVTLGFRGSPIPGLFAARPEQRVCYLVGVPPTGPATLAEIGCDGQAFAVLDLVEQATNARAQAEADSDPLAHAALQENPEQALRDEAEHDNLALVIERLDDQGFTIDIADRSQLVLGPPGDHYRFGVRVTWSRLAESSTFVPLTMPVSLGDDIVAAARQAQESQLAAVVAALRPGTTRDAAWLDDAVAQVPGATLLRWRIAGPEATLVLADRTEDGVVGCYELTVTGPALDAAHEPVACGYPVEAAPEAQPA